MEYLDFIDNIDILDRKLLYITTLAVFTASQEDIVKQQTKKPEIHNLYEVYKIVRLFILIALIFLLF